MLSILCVRLTRKVKVGMPESFKVGWYPPKKLGRVTSSVLVTCYAYRRNIAYNTHKTLARPSAPPEPETFKVHSSR